jgi:hypothetical protein
MWLASLGGAAAVAGAHRFVEGEVVIAAADVEEQSAEEAEAAEEAAEARAQEVEFAEERAVAMISAKGAEEFPALAKRAARLHARLVKLEAIKQELRELPQKSHRRKTFLPRKHERIKEVRKRLQVINQEVRAKKEAARV